MKKNSPSPRHLLAAAVAAALATSALAAPRVDDALAAGRLGLHSAGDFRLAGGDCRDCPTPPQALWYFRGDIVAVPKAGAAGFAARQRPQDDVRGWQAEGGDKAGEIRPSLLWIGSPQVARGKFAAAGDALQAEGEALPLAVVPRIEANRSYYNPDSVRHFAGRDVKARGRLEDGKFVARTLWPEDYALDGKALAPRPLAGGETLLSLVRANGGGAAQPFAARLLWSRSGKPVDLAGKPALALVLNGAQGDDDEAHGGHFALATGAFGPKGEWDDWLVNNFYNLDSVSEKGIIASTLPMDAYQGDLNSGQSWYRPSYVLMAVFKDGRGPARYQAAIDRVFNHFYRHDFRYNHATANCAGINLETLRTLGWAIPKEGPDSRLKALAALPYMAIKDGSLDSGRKAYDYLAAEKTELYPLVAFAAAGDDLLRRLAPGRDLSTPYEHMLSEDLEALVFVRLPQFPSSRALGQAPVGSLDEYMARAPADRSQWQVVPVPPRPFPPEMKDTAAPAEEMAPSDMALAGYAGAFAVLGVGGWRVKRRRNRKNA